MPIIENKTSKPLSVSLPGNKKLRLGPLKSGEISSKAVDHPAVQKLIEAGEVEVSGPEQRPRHAARGGKGSPRSSGAQGRGGVVRHTGDR